METCDNQQSFSVDFLLGLVTASAISTPEMSATEQQQQLLQIAQRTEVAASALGDTGCTLVQQVETYLAEATDDLQRFNTMVQQLGDACLDHTVEHSVHEEAQSTESHNHQPGSNASGSHDHATTAVKTRAAKKRKTKRHRRNSLLDLYLLQVAQQRS